MNENYNIKVQVLIRSFYEDAYLDFFIKYYLKLGFDRIVIFKADLEELGNYNLQDDIDKSKVMIKYVKNEGNDIYKNPENFKYYSDTNYDWSLHIDADEFLVFDTKKYSNIKEYIIGIHKNLNIELNDLFAIKFRWICINKLNNKWKLNDNQKFKTDNKYSYISYLNNNELETYSFIKTLYQTNKLLQDCQKMLCHEVKFNQENKENRLVIDNNFTNTDKFKSPLYEKERNYCNGFIIHFNTRSYNNALTKCLVTILRENKKIQQPEEFRKFINTLTPDDFTNNITEIKKTYLKHLGSKHFFPNKIKKFNNKYKHLIDYEMINNQIQNFIEDNNSLLNENFIDIKKEENILQKLCEEKNINYYNIKNILDLF